MTENPHNDDLLIRYLDGELSAEEGKSLEERLRADETLREQLTNLQVAIQAVKHLGTTQRVQAVHSEMMKKLKPGQKAAVVFWGRTFRYALAIAASLVVLFIGVKFYRAAQLSPENLYNESFVDFNVSATRATGGHLSEIETLYQQKDYKAITGNIRSLHLNAKDSLLIGLAYLQTDHASQALGFFQALAFSANDYRQDAEFYLALGYLKNKAYGKALPLMEKISADSSHLYHEQLPTDAVQKVKKLAAE